MLRGIGRLCSSAATVFSVLFLLFIAIIPENTKNQHVKIIITGIIPDENKTQKHKTVKTKDCNLLLLHLFTVKINKQKASAFSVKKKNYLFLSA